MNEKLLNVKEVSNYLNLAKSTIYNYVKEKSIPSIKLNGRLLFSRDQIDLWIKSNSQSVKNKAKNESKR